MTKTSFVLAAFLCATSVFAQSVETVAPKNPAPAASAPMPTFNARCATCTERIDGKVTVERDGVRFCCSSWVKAGAKVAVRCPYSFNLPITSVTEQYLETVGPSWHIVSGGADFTFTGTDATAMKAAYERVKTLRDIPSHFAERFEHELAKLPKPAAVTAGECR